MAPECRLIGRVLADREQALRRELDEARVKMMASPADGPAKLAHRDENGTVDVAKSLKHVARLERAYERATFGTTSLGQRSHGRARDETV